MKANGRENSREKDHPLAIFMTISQEKDERKETKKKKKIAFLYPKHLEKHLKKKENRKETEEDSSKQTPPAH